MLKNDLGDSNQTAEAAHCVSTKAAYSTLILISVKRYFEILFHQTLMKPNSNNPLPPAAEAMPRRQVAYITGIIFLVKPLIENSSIILF